MCWGANKNFETDVNYQHLLNLNIKEDTCFLLLHIKLPLMFAVRKMKNYYPSSIHSIHSIQDPLLDTRNMDYQEPTTTKPNFVSRQSLHVKVDEITMKLTGIRPGWSGLCRLVGY